VLQILVAVVVMGLVEGLVLVLMMMVVVVWWEHRDRDEEE